MLELKMRVLLITPKVNTAYSKIGDYEEIGLGILYIASALKKAGHEVSVQLVDEESVFSELSDFGPDIVGVSCVTATYNASIRILEAVKSFDKSIVTIIGGHHVTFTVKETLEESCIDYLIRGEGEEVIPELLDNIEAGKLFKLVRGVCFKKKNKLFNQNSIALVKDLDSIPFPDRSFIKDRSNTFIICSRGCPFKCNFCSISNFYNGAWRKRKISSVLDELEQVKGIYNGKVRVAFRDDSFTVDTKWTKDLCKGMIDRGFKFKWWCNSRVDSINKDEKLLSVMRDSGCNGISLGLESGVQEIINSYHKGITLEQARNAALKAREHSIKQIWYFMIGSGDKYDRPRYIKKSVNFMKDFPFDLVQISLLTPYPGTCLYEKLKQENRIINTNWDDYDGIHCVYKPVGMSPKKLEAEFGNAYKELYFSGGLFKTLKRLNNFRSTLVNSKNFLNYLKLFFKVGVLKKSVHDL